MSQFWIEEFLVFLDNLTVGGVVFYTLVHEKTYQKRNMKNTKLQLALVVASLIGAVSARATLVGDFTIGPGNSTDITWTDTSGGTLINGLEAVIVGGGATFDNAVNVGLTGWTGTLLSPTLTYATGPESGADRTISLYLADPAPASGIVVDIFELYNGVVVDNPPQAWQFKNLGSAGSGTINDVTYDAWQYISPDALVPVPETSTVIAGASLLLPFGFSTARILRQRLTA